MIFCLVCQVRTKLSEEALHIIQGLTPRQYWDELVAFADEHVSLGMSNQDWVEMFGWNSRVLNFLVGDGKSDPNDPNYD